MVSMMVGMSWQLSATENLFLRLPDAAAVVVDDVVAELAVVVGDDMFSS
jgi:hypothetical protein